MLRIREILLKMSVMQIPGLIHHVRVEHRHLIQVLLVDVPEQVAVVWVDGVEADLDWLPTFSWLGCIFLTVLIPTARMRTSNSILGHFYEFPN